MGVLWEGVAKFRKAANDSAVVLRHRRRVGISRDLPRLSVVSGIVTERYEKVAAADPQPLQGSKGCDPAEADRRKSPVQHGICFAEYPFSGGKTETAGGKVSADIR